LFSNKTKQRYEKNKNKRHIEIFFNTLISNFINISKPKERKSTIFVARKGQNSFFHASARRGKTKIRFFMFPRGAERPKFNFSCFRAARKGQMEKKRASERLRKTKWRKNMLLSDSERPNGEKTCF